jgi:HEAT repeat protein
MRSLVSLLVLTAASLVAADWTPLFDGKTLHGWTRAGYCNGQADYTVEDGCIVGTTKIKTPNSFLLADKQYANFILEMDFKVPEGMNSGVQIRSICDPNVKNGRVHGYQVEIDPSARGWTAGIYDEARRGWLYNITKIKDKKAAAAAKNAFKPNDWNHFRVEAINDHIRTWLNGVPVSDLTDGLTRKGVIALQVHQTGDPKPKQIRWRNIRIQDLGDSGTTRDLLGDLAEKMGAKPPAGATVLVGADGDVSALQAEKGADAPFPWQVKDGVMTIVPGKGSVMSRQEFRDFRLHLEFNVNGKPKHSQDDGNSGVYIQRRYELQILNSYKQPLAFNECGALYRTKSPDTNASRPAGEWQSYDLVFRSPRWDKAGKKTEDARISVSQNGILIHDNVAIPNKTGAGRPEANTPGPIKLQDHGNPVRFRNVWVEEVRTLDRAMSEEAAAKLALRAYTAGDSRVPLIALENQAKNADEATRSRLEGDMIKLLDDPKVTDDAKDFACHLLLFVGSPKAVPALAKALAVERLSNRACIAIAAIPGQASTEVLRQGLSLKLSSRAKGDIMNALVERKDQGAVPLLVPFLKDKDQALVGTALAALGNLGGRDALQAIQNADVPKSLAAVRGRALLGCASYAAQHGDIGTAEALLAKLTEPSNAMRTRLGAYGLLCRIRGDKGVDVALSLLAMKDVPLCDLGGQLVPGLPGGTATTARLCAAIQSLPPTGKAVLVPALAARGDRRAALSLQVLLASPGPLRAEAIKALGVLGSADSVPPLLPLAMGKGEEAGLAQKALVRLPDEKVDTVLIGVLKGSAELAAKNVAVTVLAQRGCTQAIPALAETIASHADSKLGRECWKALRDLTPGTTAEFSRLLSLLPGLDDRGELRDAERTLATVGGKMDDAKARDQLIVATLGKVKGRAKATAISLAGKFPADASLNALTAALKDEDEDIRYAALKALMEWPDSAPAPALLAFAKETKSEAHHALAIRGYVRLVSLAVDNEDDLKAKLTAALAVARRDAEKQLIKESMSALRITEIKAKNGKHYELVRKGFHKGGLVYIDRQYVFTDVPSFLATADLIKTAMNDRPSRAKDQTTFRISRPATIVVCYDNRAKTCPGWLKSWKKLDMRLSSTDRACKLELYAKRFPAGKVEIHGNSPVPDVAANHIIGITAAPIP